MDDWMLARIRSDAQTTMTNCTKAELRRQYLEDVHYLLDRLDQAIRDRDQYRERSATSSKLLYVFFNHPNNQTNDNKDQEKIRIANGTL